MEASLNIIVGEINALVKDLAAADGKASRLVKQYRAAKREKLAINEKIVLLRSLAEKVKAANGVAVPPPPGESEDEPEAPTRHPIPIRGGTTTAVMKTLKAAGRPMKGSELAEILEGKLDTKAKYPVRLIQSTLINLKNRGLLLQNPHGAYYPDPDVPDTTDVDESN
jgi:hypothetical protein